MKRYLCHLQVTYLRQFSNLQMLALKGNPISCSESYHSFVITHIPSLVYLDYKRIMEEEV